MVQGGIFATDGSSAFGTSNRVFGSYCSSDLWSGNAAASNVTFGFAFRGSQIVAAISECLHAGDVSSLTLLQLLRCSSVTDLIETQGMGAIPGQQLLFGGCSAGGAPSRQLVVSPLTPCGAVCFQQSAQ